MSMDTEEVNMDDHLEEAYEDRFFVEDTDEEDGFVWGWADDEPTGSLDYSDDADALASAGWGTDEDYGFFGYDDE